MDPLTDSQWFDSALATIAGESSFHAFADLLPMMIWQQDANGSVTFANETWHRITELPRDPFSFTTQSWEHIVHPDDLPGCIKVMSAAIQSHGAYEFEYRIKSYGGGEDTYRWYFARATPQYVGNIFQGWIGLITDIHASKTREVMERELRYEAINRENELRTLAETIPVMVWSAGPSGAIEWYNKRYYDYTGQTPEEAVGWGWQQVHHDEDLPMVMREWPRSIATGEPLEIEFRLRRYDGVFESVLVRAVPVRDQTGAIVRWYGTVIVLEAQKKLLEKSQRAAETLQRVVLLQALPKTERVRFDAVYAPAEEDALVGGDWFDVLELPDGRFLLSIGDVMGHGLEASVIACQLRQAIVDFSFVYDDPVAIMDSVNRVLSFRNPEVYATALVGLVDRSCTTLSYASAGHPSPFIAYTKDTPVTALPSRGTMLGVREDLGSQAHRIELRPDAILAFYTDGLIEFDRKMDAAEERLKEGLLQLVGDTSDPVPATTLKQAVMRDSPRNDDVALMIMQCSPAIPVEFKAEPSNDVMEWRFHSSDALSARSARLQLMKFMREFVVDSDELCDCETILGELVANTVEHAPGLVDVRIDWSAESPILTVVDSGPGTERPSTMLPYDALNESGRGLFLVDFFAWHVAIESDPAGGLAVCVALPVTRASA